MNEIRAQKGVPMALMNGSGYPTEWDGTTLRNLEGEERLRTVAEWKQGKYRLYTRPEGIRVLPPLDEPEPAIEAVTVGYAVEPPKPDTKALLIKKAIADLELVCKDITKPVGSHVAKNRYRVCADYVVRIRRVIKTLKETSNAK